MNVPMTRKERFLKTLAHEEVDKVPHGDMMVHEKLCAKLTDIHLPEDEKNALQAWVCDTLSDENFKRHVMCRELLNFDYVMVFPREEPIDKGVDEDGIETVKNVWGIVTKNSAEVTHFEEPPIKGPQDITKYEFPKPTDFKYDNMERWLKETDFAVLPQLDCGFFKINQLTGFEQYMEYILTNPNEMHALMEKYTEFECAMVDHLIEMGVDCILLANDYAYNQGVFISPKMLWEFDYQYTKRIVEHCHSRGKPIAMHACGNQSQVMGMIVDSGLDAIQALQPTAHNDIYAYKREYGKDICLMGNMDINHLMPDGSPYEVDRKIKEMVEKLWYDRTGWVLGTANLLNHDIPADNALTMHLAIEKYGR
jgi:uroporphyrinogen decarboxylase